MITTHSKKQYVYIGYGEEVADDMPASMIRRGFHIAEHDGTLDDAFVEFIPMFDIPNKKSFSWWVNDTYPEKIITKENMGKLFFDYMMETRFSLTQQNMDKYWETAPMAECIHSLILPIYNSNISIDFIEEPKTFNYTVTIRASGILRNLPQMASCSPSLVFPLASGPRFPASSNWLTTMIC